MRLQEAKQQATLAQWQQRVSECRHSGQSVSEWCNTHGVGQSTYYRRQKQLWEQEHEGLSYCGPERAAGTKERTIIQAPQFVQAPLAALMTRQANDLAGLVIRIGVKRTFIGTPVKIVSKMI